MFIELTNKESGLKVYKNVNKIFSFFADGDFGTKVFLSKEKGAFFKETPEEIMQLIKEASK